MAWKASLGFREGLYWGYIGIMESKMETTIGKDLGFRAYNRVVFE